MTTVSIEFFVDENADALMAFEHTHENEIRIAASMEVLCLPLDKMRALDPGDIQRAIGRFLLSFLSSRSTKELNLPRDLEDERRLDDDYFNQLLTAARSNEPKEIYELAIGLIARGMNNESWDDLEQGERLLNQAIAAGLPAAIKYQSETWELIRPRLEQRLKYTPD